MIYQMKNVKDAAEFEAICQCLNYRFKDPRHLAVALTHSSFKSKGGSGIEPYERYEFLGDAVLDLILSEELMNQNPNAREGLLSKWRATLVNEMALSKVAGRMGIQEFILVGEKERLQSDFFRPRLLASVFEALVAAIYLDAGLASVRGFVLELMKDDIRSAVLFEDVESDHKSRLQEWSQKNGRALPKYEVVETLGPEHRPSFRVQVWINSEALGEGIGLSKKAAEQEAALAAKTQLEKNGEWAK